MCSCLFRFPIARRYTRGITAVVMSWAVAWAVSVQAEIVNEVQIESEPSVAEVFLRQGTKRSLLGMTPLRTQFEFHSELSVLLLVVSKNGFETQNVELGATQKRIVVTLVRRKFAAHPDKIANESLRNVQGRIVKRIERAMLSQMSASAAMEWEPGGTIGVESLDGQVYLMVPIKLSESGRMKTAVSLVEDDKSVRDLWVRVAARLVKTFGEVALQERAIKGVIVDVEFGKLRQQFGVGSQVESRLEEQCVPGTETRQVYQPCARYVPRAYTDSFGVHTRSECVAEYVTTYVHNPCQTRTQVTVSEVKVDPRATVKQGQVHLRFVATSEAIEHLRSGQDVFSEVGYVKSDDSGRILERKGRLPLFLAK